MLVAIDCFISTRSLLVTFLSIPSLFVQMIGYGWGFIKTIVDN
jgi:hypothetical protein